MIRRSPAAPLLLTALAGTALFAIPVRAEPVEPTKEVEAEVTASDLEAVEEWIETPLGQSIIESLPADPSFAPHRRLASLLAMPQFHDWSLSLSNTKLPHFEAYLKHMLEVEHCQDIVRREMSEYTDLNALGDGPGTDEEEAANRQFVFTVMTDLGYLITLSDQQVAEIEEAAWSLYNESVSAYLQEFTKWAEQNEIRDATASAVRRTFERTYEEATRIFRNPACALAYQPYALQFKDGIRSSAQERFRGMTLHSLDSTLRFASDDPAQLHLILTERAEQIAISAAQMINLSIQPGRRAGVRVIETRAEWDEFSRLTDRFSHFGDIESYGPVSVNSPGFQDGKPLFYAGYTIANTEQQLGIPRVGSPLVSAIKAKLGSGRVLDPHTLLSTHPDWFASAAGSAAAAYLPSGYSNPVESLLGELLELDEFRRVTMSIEADDAKRDYLVAYFNTVLPRWRWDEVDRPRLVVHTVMTDLTNLESLDATAMQSLLTKRAAQIETLAQIRRDRLHDLFAPLDLEQTDRELFDRFFEIGMADLNEVAKNPAFLASARPLTDGEMIEAKSYVIQFWDSDLSMLERAVRDLKEFQDNKDAWAERMNEESLKSRHQMHYSRLKSACRTLVMKAIAETAQAAMKPTVRSPLPEAFHAWRPSRSAQASMSNTLNNDKYCLDVVPTIVPVGF